MTTPIRQSPARPRAEGPATRPEHGYEIVFEKRLLAKGALAAVIAELKSLVERSGAIAGSVYALAAGAVLANVERLEDAKADLRFRRRSQLPTARRAHPETRGASQPHTPLPTK
jgi:hypothetical protein